MNQQVNFFYIIYLDYRKTIEIYSFFYYLQAFSYTNYLMVLLNKKDLNSPGADFDRSAASTASLKKLNDKWVIY